MLQNVYLRIVNISRLDYEREYLAILLAINNSKTSETRGHNKVNKKMIGVVLPFKCVSIFAKLIRPLRRFYYKHKAADSLPITGYKSEKSLEFPHGAISKIIALLAHEITVSYISRYKLYSLF